MSILSKSLVDDHMVGRRTVSLIAAFVAIGEPKEGWRGQTGGVYVIVGTCGQASGVQAYKTRRPFESSEVRNMVCNDLRLTTLVTDPFKK
jgi:hypothetical protein